MERARRILTKLLHPPVRVLLTVPPLSFAALIAVFVRSETDRALTYLIYSLSAYSLTVWAAAVPALARRAKAAVKNSGLAQHAAASPVAGRYLSDPVYRGSVGLCQGMAANFLYCLFRAVAGLHYGSVWFLSMAAYYLVLGLLRAYLLTGYRHRISALERRRYRTTAWLLFLLNIPMGGMIVLMVRTDSGYSYPGYIIYLSALYTFYAVTAAVMALIKFRRPGSPILSTAKVLSLAAALMSVLGLQTAMISRFSANGEGYRRMMNAITGGCVYGIVIILAVSMLLRSRAPEKKVNHSEPL